MSTAASLPGPAIWALAGAGVAAGGLIAPQWWFGAGAYSVAEDLPLIAVALVSLYAQVVLSGETFRRRLLVMLAVATVVAVATGLAAWWLYASGRPGLLAERAALLAGKMSHVSAPDGHAVPVGAWLNPHAQALQQAVSVLFWGVLFGGFAAFRARRRELLPRR